MVSLAEKECRICLRIRFYQRKKLHMAGISEKSNKVAVNSSGKSFKQASL